MKFRQLWQRSLLWLVMFWCILALIYRIGWFVLGAGILIWLILIYLTARSVFWIYLSYLTFNKEKTERFLSKAISYKPLLRQPYITLGVIYAREKRWPEAISVLEQVSGLPEYKSGQDIKTMLAISYRENGAYQRALELLTELIDQGKKNFGIWINLAITYFKLAKYEEALEAAGKARSFDLKSCQPVLLMGRIHFERQEFQNAKDDYEWALKHMSWPVETYYWLGRIELELGNREAATIHLTKAVERIKDDPELSDVTLNEAEEWLNKVKN